VQINNQPFIFDNLLFSLFYLILFFLLNTRMRYFQLALVLLLFSLESCGCKNKNASNNSTQGTSYNPDHRIIKNNFLLSAQLQNRKLQDIFTDKEIQELNLIADTPIILEQVNEEGIYQIKFPNQKGANCGYHSIRNYA